MDSERSDEFVFKHETYEIIGICMDVHRTLGNGFLEIVYKDAIGVQAFNFLMHWPHLTTEAFVQAGITQMNTDEMTPAYLCLFV